MSKVGITGHSKGLGRAIFDRLSVNHECVGFSRSNNYNIVTTPNLIVKQIEECDVFVNNAHSGFMQLNLLNMIWQQWRADNTKTIVNISSLARYPGISQNADLYSTQKAALSHQANIIQRDPNRKCRVINVNPGYMATGMTAHRDERQTSNMLSASEVANIVCWALSQPQHIEIGEIGVWPTTLAK